MKNGLIKTALVTIALFQSATNVIAEDYSGHHNTSEGGGFYDNDFVMGILIVAALFWIVLWILMKIHK